MKKKYKILLVIIFIICLIPKIDFYKDGGTVTYSAVFYKIIDWNQLEGKQGMEFHIFPNNFHRLDYYSDFGDWTKKPIRFNYKELKIVYLQLYMHSKIEKKSTLCMLMQKTD